MGARSGLGGSAKEYLKGMFLNAYDRDLLGFANYREKSGRLVKELEARYSDWEEAAKACENAFGLDLDLLIDTLPVVRDKHVERECLRMELDGDPENKDLAATLDKTEKELCELSHALMRLQRSNPGHKMEKYLDLTRRIGGLANALDYQFYLLGLDDGLGERGKEAVRQIRLCLDTLADLERKRADYLADAVSEFSW